MILLIFSTLSSFMYEGIGMNGFCSHFSQMIDSLMMMTVLHTQFHVHYLSKIFYNVNTFSKDRITNQFTIE